MCGWTTGGCSLCACVVLLLAVECVPCRFEWLRWAFVSKLPKDSLMLSVMLEKKFWHDCLMLSKGLLLADSEWGILLLPAWELASAVWAWFRTSTTSSSFSAKTRKEYENAEFMHKCFKKFRMWIIQKSTEVWVSELKIETRARSKIALEVQKLKKFVSFKKS